MALFQIFKGKASTLASKKPNTVEGYCYFTEDDGKFYIDTATGTGTSKRVVLNAYKADIATSANGVAWSNVSGRPSTMASPEPLNIQVAGTTKVAYYGSAEKALNFKNGSNISITGDTSGNITIANTYSYTLPKATTSALGGVKVGYTTSGKNYAVNIDTNGNLYVNVPWTDNNTTYTFTNKAATLAWNTAVTIATVGGTDITVKLPANPNSDTKVTQTVTSSNASYPLLLAPSGQTANTTTTSYFDSGVTLNPSTNTIVANISGNAGSASSLRFTSLASDIDLNDITTPGFYSASATATAQTIVNNPLSNLSTGILVKVYTVGSVEYQEVSGTIAGGIWKRRHNGDTWSSWVQMATTSDNVASATQLKNSRTIDGVSFNGTAAITHYGECSTAAATVAKTVALTGFTLVTGARIAVKFTVTNTAANPTLNVNSTGAKAIMYRGSAISKGYLAASRIYEFVYDGTDWELIGDVNTNTTYSAFTGATSSAAGKAGLVPAPASGKTGLFLRSDGTWYDLIAIDGTTLDTFAELKAAWEGADSTLTTTLNNAISAKAPTNHASTATTYGVSTASNYGHAMASSTTPKALGTAAIGSETAKFARGDHVHPLPALTSCTGTLTVAKGGTGKTSFSSGYVLIGNGTSAIKTESAHFNYLAGTTSVDGYEEFVLGNSTASGTADNRFGRLALYSKKAGGIYLTAADATSWSATNTLPNTSGTILNTGTTSWTDRDAATAKIGTLKINGTNNILYDLLLQAQGKNISTAEITDINTIKAPSVYYSNNSTETSGITNSPQSASSGYRLMTFAGYQGASSYGWQLAAASSKIYWRLLGSSNGSPTDWYGWIKFKYGTAVGSATAPIYLTSDGIPTKCSTYAGGTKVTLNNSDKGASTATIYAPTAGGSSGQYLKAVGSTSAPAWTSFAGLTIKTKDVAGTETTKVNAYTPATAVSAVIGPDDIFKIHSYSVTKALALNTWTDVATATNLGSPVTGTYILQVTAGSVVYSGVMSWDSSTTAASGIYDEILLHSASTSSAHVTARVNRDGSLRLQLCALDAAVASSSITVKMRRMI